MIGLSNNVKFWTFRLTQRLQPLLLSISYVQKWRAIWRFTGTRESAPKARH
jgi:hypothetical protein